MRAKILLPALAVLALSACGSQPPETLSSAPSSFGQAAPGKGQGPPAHANAKVPIAGVAPEAAGVNSGSKKQASGLKKGADRGKGHKGSDVSDTALAGGCVPGYGDNGACLPPVPPRLVGAHAGHGGMSGMEMAQEYTCADVRAMIPDGLKVLAGDTLGLDSNGDGVACGTGDV